MKKRKIAILISAFLVANLINFGGVSADSKIKVSPLIEANYYSMKQSKSNIKTGTPKGTLALENIDGEEKQGVQSFCADGDNFYLLDSINDKVLVYNSGKYVKEIKLSISNPLDIMYENNILYVHNGTSLLKYNLKTNENSVQALDINGQVKPHFRSNRNGDIFVGNTNISSENASEKGFRFSLAPSAKNTKKYVNLISENKVVEIEFTHQNGGAQIIGEDKYNNTYVEAKDIEIGKAIDFYQDVIYKINSSGKVVDKFIIPDDASYTLPYKYIYIDTKGNIYYLFSDIDGAKVYQLNKKESKSFLSSILPDTDVKAISRKDAQARAFSMADVKWHYIKSRNGNYTASMRMPTQLIGETDSYETGIPYAYGGNDSMDDHSGYGVPWSNFIDAIENHGAVAGNTDCDYGYVWGTAGIDCSGYVQDVFKIPRSTRYSTWNFSNVLIPIYYYQLTDMDVLLNVGDHIVIFQSWLYDEYGGILGANTIESTAGSNDGTGWKVKRYYRTIDELHNGYGDGYTYQAMRYNSIDSDYIESNTSAPAITAPLYGQDIAKDTVNNTLKFSWQFKAPYAGASQTAYRIRIYKGIPAATNEGCGTFINELSGSGSGNQVSTNIGSLSQGNYYMVIELKNDKGYWSSPEISPFIVWNSSGDVKQNPVIKSDTRLAGQNRYDTSASIAKAYSDSAVSNVVIATGSDFPDGLTSTLLSKKYNAPILLVNSSFDTNSATIGYINTHLRKDGHIYIAGGTGVVSDQYVNYFVSKGFNKDNIIRLGGRDRNETAVKIANWAGVTPGTPVVIANEDSFADSLSIASIAAQNGWPILITGADTLDSNIKDYLEKEKPSRIYVVGGNGVISNDLVNNIASVANISANSIQRLGGQNRYATSEIVATYFYGSGSTSQIFLAYGEDFPDALCIAGYAVNKGPVVLTYDSHYLDSFYTIKSIVGSGKVNLTIAGGTGVISDNLISKLKYMYNNPQ